MARSTKQRGRNPSTSIGPGAAKHAGQAESVALGLSLKAETLAKGGVRLTWAGHPDVKRWKVTCNDSTGRIVRRATLTAHVLSLTLGRLEDAPQPLQVRVCGLGSGGRLVCEGWSSA